MNPFTILAPPLGQLLSILFNIWPHNYGVAIIFLTLIVSLLLFPLTLKQTRSMKAMQDIQPEVKALQKELKHDREELNKQMMALYQERGVNPAAGCLPLIIQMPIWFALFRVLRVTPNDAGTVLDPSDIIPGDSRLARALLDGNSDFLGMNMLDSPQALTADGIVGAIPAIILIAVVVASGFYQSVQTTRNKGKNGNNQQETKQGQQMQTVAKIMPLFMGFISWGFPTGLVLYFAVSNLFRIGQQGVIFRMDGNGDDGSSAVPAKDKGATPEPPVSRGPSPNASKKRNRRRRK